MVQVLLSFALLVVEALVCPVLFLAALLARFSRKPVDVGIGPEPLISHVHHKKALEQYGYSVETFVAMVYFITGDFDRRFDQKFQRIPVRQLRTLLAYLGLYFLVIRRYKGIFIYFNGGCLMFSRYLLWRLEPFFYHLAKVKVVVMPYGGDVQDMTRSPNLLFKDAMASDYPQHYTRREMIARKITLWTHHANHIISGCEWVDYMYQWHTLMPVHFSIDLDAWRPDPAYQPVQGPLRILHAPNHRAIKGTRFFIEAVEQLQAEGLDIELVILEHVPNEEIKAAIQSVDVVADQLIVGWYAMFAMEAMALEKPVLCYLRDDLMTLFVVAGVVEAGEIPIVNCNPLTVKEAIRNLALHPEQRAAIGKQSRAYVEKHHSLASVGHIFSGICQSMGIAPSHPARQDSARSSSRRP